MKYYDVLALPLRTFWAYNRQVNRLRAEADQRQLRLIGSSGTPEAANKLNELLEMEIGKPTVIEKKFDAKKFAELRNKFSGK